MTPAFPNAAHAACSPPEPVDDHVEIVASPRETHPQKIARLCREIDELCRPGRFNETEFERADRFGRLLWAAQALADAVRPAPPVLDPDRDMTLERERMASEHDAIYGASWLER